MGRAVGQLTWAQVRTGLGPGQVSWGIRQLPKVLGSFGDSGLLGTILKGEKYDGGDAGVW